MIYTEKWAFIHIPKTGGLNFIKRLEYQPGVINAHVSLPRHYNHQSLQWWLDHKVLDESQLIFTFVRHPYTRLVSLYNSKIYKFIFSSYSFIFCLGFKFRKL